MATRDLGTIFKAYDVRGLYPQELDEENPLLQSWRLTELFDPGVCLLALLKLVQRIIDQPSQILDQGDPQHDCDCPQLPQGKGSCRLIGLDKALNRFGI